MEHSITIKRIAAAVFVIILFVGFIKSGSFSQLTTLSSFLAKSKDDQSTIDAIESNFSNNLSYKEDLVNLNGAISKKTQNESVI